MLLRRTRRLPAVVAILVAVLWTASAAHAQYADVLSCLRSDTDAPPTSSSFLIGGDGFVPGAQVTVTATQGTSELSEVADAAPDTSFEATLVLTEPDWDLTAPIEFEATGPSGPEGNDVRTVMVDAADCAVIAGVTRAAAPTPTPTAEPTPEPTEEPTAEPTEEPAREATPEPTDEPTPTPTAEPTPSPTAEPTPTSTPVPLEELTFTSASTMPMVTIAVGAVALGAIVLFGLRRPGA